MPNLQLKQEPIPGRLGYSVKEFGDLFGRGKDWVYKLIYAGKLKKIEDFGGLIIPATEAERILKSASTTKC